MNRLRPDLLIIIIRTESDLTPRNKKKIVDAKNGKELWKFQVGSGVIGNAFTYAISRRKLIAIRGSSIRHLVAPLAAGMLNQD